MKFKNIYKIAALLLLYVGLQSRMNGPGQVQGLQVTGAPGSTGQAAGQPGTCGNSGCHNATTFNPTLGIQLLDGASAVTSYEPGKTYTLQVSVAATSGNPAEFGFQAVALNGANVQAGDWGAPGSGKHVVTLSARKYVEHSAPAGSGTFEVPWIAPAAGAGAVTFYSAGNATNGNGQSTGDQSANSSLAVAEGPANSTADPARPQASLQVLPNPVGETLTVEITSRTAGAHRLRILNVQGEVVQVEPVHLQVGANQPSFGVGALAPGLYVVQLCGEGHLAAAQMLKI